MERGQGLNEVLGLFIDTFKVFAEQESVVGMPRYFVDTKVTCACKSMIWKRMI